MFHLI